MKLYFIVFSFFPFFRSLSNLLIYTKNGKLILWEKILPKMECWFSNFFDFCYIYRYLERFCYGSKILPYFLISTRSYLPPCKAVIFPAAAVHHLLIYSDKNSFTFLLVFQHSMLY